MWHSRDSNECINLSSAAAIDNLIAPELISLVPNLQTEKELVILTPYWLAKLTHLSRSSVNVHDFWRTASNSTKLQLLSSLSISSIALAFSMFGLMPFRSNDDTIGTKLPRMAAINADSLPMPHCWFKSIGQTYAWCSGCMTCVPSKRHFSNLSISPSLPDKHAIYSGVWPKLSSKFGSNAHSYSQSPILQTQKQSIRVFIGRATLNAFE